MRLRCRQIDIPLRNLYKCQKYIFSTKLSAEKFCVFINEWVESWLRVFGPSPFIILWKFQNQIWIERLRQRISRREKLSGRIRGRSAAAAREEAEFKCEWNVLVVCGRERRWVQGSWRVEVHSLLPTVSKCDVRGEETTVTTASGNTSTLRRVLLK